MAVSLRLVATGSVQAYRRGISTPHYGSTSAGVNMGDEVEADLVGILCPLPAHKDAGSISVTGRLLKCSALKVRSRVMP